MQMMYYDAAVRWARWARWASTQSLKYQTLIKGRLSKTLSKIRIGKSTEIDLSALRSNAEQELNR